MLPVIEVVDPQMAAVLRSKTGQERLRSASDMFTCARRLLPSHLRATHPEGDVRTLGEAVARRLLHANLTSCCDRSPRL